MLWDMKGLLKNEDGVTVVEFAFLAPIFFALLFSILETGIIMTKLTLLDNAVSNSARSIYIGKVSTKSEVERTICEDIVIVQNCLDNINVEVHVIESFDDTPDDPIECKDSDDTTFEPTVRYEQSAGGEIVLFRVCLSSTVVTPGLGVGLSLSKNHNNRINLVASSAFMNEPF